MRLALPQQCGSNASKHHPQLQKQDSALNNQQLEALAHQSPQIMQASQAGFHETAWTKASNSCENPQGVSPK